MLQKTDKLNIRMAPAIKEALRAVADKEHRSISNMVEFLVLRFCEETGMGVLRKAMDKSTTSRSTERANAKRSL